MEKTISMLSLVIQYLFLMNKRNTKIHAGVVASFVVLICLFFFKQLFFGKVLYCCDNATINIPSKIFLASELKEGRFPLWNPYIFAGSPYFADINLGTLYPLNIMYVLFAPFRALTVEVILSYVIAILGMYLLSRSIGLSVIASFYASLVYTFSGTIASYSNNVSMLHVAALMPIVLWSTIYFLQKTNIKSFLIASLFISLQIVSGHPQITYFTLVLSMVLIATYPKLSLKNKLTYSFLLYVFAAGLTAIQWIPFIEFASLSSRVHAGFAYASSGAFTPLGIVRLFLPNAIGDLSGFGAWAQNGSLLGYIGIIPLLVCLLPAKKNYFRLFFIITAIVSFLASFGVFSPVYFVLYYLLPGLKYMRSPEQFLVLYTISMACIAGFGFDSLKGLNKSLSVFIYLAVAAIFFGLIGIASGDTIIRYSSANAVISGVLLSLTYIIAKKFKSILRIAVISFTILELFIFSSHNILSVPETATTSIDSVVIKDFDWKQQRIFVDHTAIRYPLAKPFPKYDYINESLWQLKVLKPNILMDVYPRADGYASMVYEKYRKFIDSASSDPTGVHMSFNSENLDILGIKYIVFSNQIAENRSSCDRFFLVKDDTCQNNTVKVVTYQPNYVKITTHPASDAFVVFTDVNYPGWQVYVDGKKDRIADYKNIFKSVWVKAGDHIVEFVFRPDTYIYGKLITFLSVSVFLLLAIIAILKNRRSSVH